MSKIRIKNFGPIRDGYLGNNGWMDINKVTVFIGNQGSGKSTAAKLISTFLWMEKAIIRGDTPAKWLERERMFKHRILYYHRLENYSINPEFDQSLIEYDGDVCHIKYEMGNLEITNKNNPTYFFPQIVYIPAERNFISYVKSANELRLSSEALKDFIAEFENAKIFIANGIKLPLDNSRLHYNPRKDTLILKGDNFNIDLSESSSGFQSFIPLYLVSNHLAHAVASDADEQPFSMNNEERKKYMNTIVEILGNHDLTPEQQRLAISAASKKFRKSAFINIVEEPEQNLFPSSQWIMLSSLLKFNNMGKHNRLIATTHSPYIVGYLNLAIQSNVLRNRIKSSSNLELLKELNAVIPEAVATPPESVAVYELDDKTGSISKLPNYDGILSDENYLNKKLREGNQLFDKLLEIEDKLG